MAKEGNRLKNGQLRTCYAESEMDLIPYGYKVWKVENSRGVFYCITRAAVENCTDGTGRTTVSVFRSGSVLMYHNEMD